ncbi:sulfite exporter TauE/SafE family protein [Bacteriovorax sp. DB6_IX]|uniref:sulfite exporter TauE/SafE family protein n=1 Tax=Bacteriovorax sp. DB6_IX TaxID=1353530 RepID=UPI000389F98B|nr:sulfite exporter TauE/SafE family protein [Bacteriovorax sp. DB6_IX]EQC51666.1 DsbD family 2 [Bacteriovorax sp. DB6_IX]
MDQLTELNNVPLYMIIFAGLVTGLGGSVHCTGMCGGLVTALTRSKKGILSYHLGRLLGYISLGVIIPLLGIEALGVRDNKYLSLFAATTLGLTFIFIGLKSIFKWQMSFKFHTKLEGINQSIWKTLFAKLSQRDLLRSFLGGSASVLLPCGLLWTIIILSLTATSPVSSLAFIISFWLGTTPALSFAPGIIQKFLLPLQRKLPRTIPLFFILIGVLTISTRVYSLYQQAGGQSCH